MIQDSCQVLSYLTERRITCSIPADCLFPNDDVGRGDIPLAMLAVPSCDTNFIDVFSALRYRSAGSAEMEASSACQLFAFTESSARVRLVGKHARRTEEWVEGNMKGGPENISTWTEKCVFACLGPGAGACWAISLSTYKMTINPLIWVSGMNCHFARLCPIPTPNPLPVRPQIIVFPQDFTFWYLVI